MPRCACASEVYGSSLLLKDQSSASKSFYRPSHVFLDFNSWICKIKLPSQVMPNLECHCRRARSKTCSPSVATLVSSALAIGSCKSEKRAARHASRIELLASIVFNNFCMQQN